MKLGRLVRELELLSKTWGNWDEKIKKCNEILKVDSNNVRAIWLRGHAHYYKQEYQLAYNDIFTANELSPGVRDHLRYLGFIHRVAREYDEAIKYFLQAEKVAPKNYAVQEDIAQTYYNMDNFTKAVEYYDRAIKLDPKNGNNVMYSRSALLAKLQQELNVLAWGQFDEKIKKADEIIKIKSDCVEALWLRGHAYYYKKEYQLAYNDIALANILKPNNVYYLRYIGFCHEACREYDEAIKYFTKAEKLSPNNYAIQEDFARVYYAKDDFIKAVEHSEKAIKLDSVKSNKTLLIKCKTLIRLHSELATMVVQWGNWDTKIVKATEILKIKPDNILALQRRGHAYYYKQEYQLSYNDFFLANNTIVKPHAYYMRYLGFCHEACAEYDKAIECFKEADKLTPNNKDIKDDFERVNRKVVNKFTHDPNNCRVISE